MGSGFIRREPDWARPPWTDGMVDHLIATYGEAMHDGRMVTADGRLLLDALGELVVERDRRKALESELATERSVNLAQQAAIARQANLERYGWFYETTDTGMGQERKVWRWALFPPDEVPKVPAFGEKPPT